MSSQLGPVFCEPVNRGEHFRKDALRADCLMVGKLRNVDTLLLHAQGRSPEQFINLRNIGGGGRIHENPICYETLYVSGSRSDSAVSSVSMGAGLATWGASGLAPTTGS